MHNWMGSKKVMLLNGKLPRKADLLFKQQKNVPSDHSKLTKGKRIIHI